ncbi:DUF1428 domain-containing protein [Pseudoruegeria sp. HB172150]|uniref:DUF1428 domain-containing protein n=1 Tax=Pseudoruegeria sp. HB172150 TaxID=2721164 RepID=UPI0015564BE4|nr:DUF1428 domain-containing protein [Pseudoruegeria sp. HB172150]
MYIAGLVIPVPEENRDAYRAWAAQSAAFFREYGCLEIVESWEDNVPDGKQTDFRRAVAAKPGEKIVFIWQVWPGRDFFNAAEEKMHQDPRMDEAGEPPFDASRLILGCFQPIHVMGHSHGT